MLIFTKECKRKNVIEHFFESVSIEIAATLTILINYYEKILKISSLTPRRINFEADVITK